MELSCFGGTWMVVLLAAGDVVFYCLGALVVFDEVLSG